MKEKNGAIQVPLPVPFSFAGPWRGEEPFLPPLDIAERQVLRHCHEAEKAEKVGDTSRAASCRERAEHWQGLEKLSLQSKADLATAAAIKASEAINELLTLAKASHSIEETIAILAYQAFNGLLALSAHGNKNAMGWFLHYMHDVLDNFRVLAKQQPEFVKEFAKLRSSIPGLISPHAELTKWNVSLLKCLEVATDPAVLPFPLMGAVGGPVEVYESPRTRWADRLRDYISNERTRLRQYDLDTAAPGWKKCKWLAKAKKLPDYSPDTWKKWAEVAWQIVMEVTGDDPACEPDLEALQNSNARGNWNTKTQAYNSKTPRAIQQDIKEALSDGFKVLAGRKPSAA